MRKSVFYCALLIMFTSCASDEVTTDSTEQLVADSLQYEQRTFLEKSKHCEDNSDNCLTISYNYVYFTESNSALCDSLNAISCQLFANRLSKKKYNCDFELFAKELIVEYQEELEQNLSASPWFYAANYGISYQDSSVISMRFSYEEFMGSAHPNAFQEELSFDKESGKRIYLTDLFTNITELYRIAEDLFRSQNNIDKNQSLEDAGYFMYDGFELTGNFSIQKNGILFFYNSYEIAPYSMGVTELLIPYESINHLFTHDYKNLGLTPKNKNT